ncbi:ribosome maturation factor RimM [Microbaculum sp. FT89]|uniref:ribosome maturation factor RimM n=1 Tax=Microbaculum sp. FT89 TaxID=3447298 RepID=UPI003F538BF6
MAADGKRVCVGVVGAPHGVRGEVRIKSYTAEPLDIAAYGPLTTENGRTVEILGARLAKTMVIAALKGVNDRSAVEALKNQRLYVDRDRMPAPEEDEWYHTDLIGLEVRDLGGETVGTVTTVQDFGGGDLLEIRLKGTPRTVFAPFTRAVVPTVDVAAGFLTIDPPEGLFDQETGPSDEDEDRNAQ